MAVTLYYRLERNYGIIPKKSKKQAAKVDWRTIAYVASNEMRYDIPLESTDMYRISQVASTRGHYQLFIGRRQYTAIPCSSWVWNWFG